MFSVPHLVFRGSAVSRAAVWALFLFAVVLRILDFLPHRSLWLDEAMLGVNIQQFGFVQLVGPLVMDQAAPVGFLWLQRLTFLLFDPADFALRVWPFVFGVASLGMVYLLARQYGEKHFSWLALALMALSPVHLRFSSELKQYTLDTLVSAVLLWLFSKSQQNLHDRRTRVALVVGGAIAIWCSYPSMFVLTGIGVAGFAFSVLRGEGLKGAVAWVSTGGIWLASFIPLYWFNIRLSSGNVDLQAYWRPHFAPLPSASEIHWYTSHLLKNSEYLFFSQLQWGAVAILALGLASLALRQRELALVILITLLSTLVASHLSMYPFYGRLLVFMMPAVAMLMAEGVDRIRRWVGQLNEVAGQATYLVLIVACLVSPLQADLTALRIRAPVSGMKPLSHALKFKYASGDQVYVYYGAVPEYRFYEKTFGFPDGSVVEGLRHRGDPQSYIQHLDSTLHNGRVWVIFSHLCCARFDERAFILKYFEARGRSLDRVDSPGAIAYLYAVEHPARDGWSQPTP